MRFAALAASTATAIFVLSASVANAAPIPFVLSDGLKVTDINQNVITQFFKSEFQESNQCSVAGDPKGAGAIVGGGCLYSFTDNQAALAPVDLSKEGILSRVFEPDRKTLSDVFGIYCTASDANDNCTAGRLAFVSDIDGVPMDINKFQSDSYMDYYEDGSGNLNGFDATMYLSESLRNAGAKALFISDTEKVPEPITLSVFGTGVMGAIAMRRRKKKTA